MQRFEQFTETTQQNDAAPATVTLNGDHYALAMHLLSYCHETNAKAARIIFAESLISFD